MQKLVARLPVPFVFTVVIITKFCFTFFEHPDLATRLFGVRHEESISTREVSIY